MSSVKPLSKALISKIAAGQVVERPSNVVKELVENSIDANALDIKIEIENGGFDLLKITDSGVGMSEEDLLEAYKSHTTSKIEKEEDLVSLETLGFRGEALSSIAAVSNLKIKSRIETEVSGFEIELESGKLIDKGSVGMPLGTAVTVRNLFYSTPARKKFLKSASTEFRYIADIVVTFALANPSIGFFLSHNKRIVLDLPADQTVAERVNNLLGSKMRKNLLPVSFENDHFKISGYVTKPQVASPIKSKQYLFVNGRAVTDKLVSGAVKDAYETLLQPRSYPPFVLFFSLPSSLVDVNVHPRKEKIAFTDSEFIYNLFKKAIVQVFETEDLVYEFDGDVDVLEKLLESEEFSYTSNLPSTIVQLHNLYLLKQTRKGILLIDQHAAHERILYEQILTNFKAGSLGKSVVLDDAITFDLSVGDTEAIEEYLKDYKKLGFDVSSFGKNTFKVSEIPWFVRKEDAVEIIQELLEDLKEGKGIKSLDSKTKHMFSTMACKSAIKSGDILTEEQSRKLFEDLEATKTNYTCPHGRPVKMELTLNELARMFKRS